MGERQSLEKVVRPNFWLTLKVKLFVGAAKMIGAQLY